MNFESLTLKIEEDILSFLSNPCYIEEIAEAKEYFYNSIEKERSDQELSLDFNSWLIYDYKTANGGTFLNKYYQTFKDTLSHEEKQFIQGQLDTYPSIYEVVEIQGNCAQIKDIFIKEEYQVIVEQEDIRVRDLILARVMMNNGQYRLTGNKQAMPNLFKSTIERSIHEHYEHYKNQNHFATWQEFLKEHSELLYKHLGIVEGLLIENDADGEALNYVWQSVYLIKDGRHIKEILQKDRQIELEDEDKGYMYFKMLSQGKILCEMALKNNRLELECTSDRDRKKAKIMIEKILGENGKHYKDEVLSINDIL